MVRLLNKLGLTNWRRRLIAALIALPVLGVTSVEVTSQSWFCNSCHIMEPYYNSWKIGAHKDVECVKCHISPGMNNFLAAKFNGLGQVVDDVLHRTSMKPSASVSALACTRSGCHDINKVRTTEKATGTYLFRHDKHLDLEYDGIKLACGTCHSHVKGSEHFEVNTNICVTCHMLERAPQNGSAAAPSESTLIRIAVRGDHAVHGGAEATTPAAPDPAAKVAPTTCATCHNPPKGTIERNGLKVTHAEYLSYGARCESCHFGTTAAPPPIVSGQCYKCHDFGVERSMSAVEMHHVHSAGEHKIECFDCHGTIQHGPAAQAARIEQFDCQKCHIDQHNVQRRTYLHDGDGSTVQTSLEQVSPMFLAHVDCTGCHVKQRPLSSKPDSGALVSAASAAGCNKCHKEGFGEKMIPLWQNTTRSLHEKVSADLKAAEAELSGDASKSEVLEHVRKLLEQVRVDGSWGVHNPRYTQKLLQEARETLVAARAKAAGGTQ